MRKMATNASREENRVGVGYPNQGTDNGALFEASRKWMRARMAQPTVSARPPVSAPTIEETPPATKAGTNRRAPRNNGDYEAGLKNDHQHSDGKAFRYERPFYKTPVGRSHAWSAMPR